MASKFGIIASLMSHGGELQIERKLAMRYSTDFDVNTFRFYGMAKDWVAEFRDAGLMDELQKAIEKYFATTCMPATWEMINDFVWTKGGDILFELSWREKKFED